MSLLVPLVAEGLHGPRAAEQRRRLRRRLLGAGAAMLVVLGMAALPLPLWRTCGTLGERVDELRGWIAEARDQERVLAAFRASGGTERANRLQQELSRWLAPHTGVDTRNELLGLAQAAGLAVADIQMTRDEDPFSLQAGAPAEVRVLGSTPAAAARPATATLDVCADRYLLSGTGTAAQVLLLCGVAHARPAPLRLRSVKLDGADGSVRFTICLEKFLQRTTVPRVLHVPE